jgi:electron transfer flavoprotein alpha subunit
MRMSEFQGIWVVTESVEGRIAPVTYELLAKSASLAAASGEKVTVVLPDSGMDSKAVAVCGADEILVLQDEKLQQYDALIYTRALSELIVKRRPFAVLFSACGMGREVAPQIAVRLGLGIATDCTDLQIREEAGKRLLVQIKPYANVEAEIFCPKTWPQLATVRPRAFALPTPQAGKQSLIVTYHPDLTGLPLLTKRIKKEAGEEKPAATLSQAKIIVAGGSGLKSRENFTKLFELAEIIGGSVGATRAAIAQGWVDEEYMIGQSGNFVEPRLYLAFGISGAPQHMCAVKKPELLVVVNRDQQAPIFQRADYGYVGDCLAVLDFLLKELKK